MSRELFVSSTPHETKVGLVEDDQLAEIYLERENEYTLAGSIYKGRVTRVLPGMQSAFVDIGLERDAFLYVSDFMELEEHDEDVSDIVPVNRGVQEVRQRPQEPPQGEPESSASPAGPTFVIESEPLEEEGVPESERPVGTTAEPGNPAEAQEREPRSWRGRRRRRGRRGERALPESRFTRSSEGPREGSRQPDRPTRSEYGPPPGYQPILLPGESISKYQRYQNQQAAPAPRAEGEAAKATPESATLPLAEAFPQDEPMFAAPEKVAQRQPEAGEYQEPDADSGREPRPEGPREQAQIRAAAHVAPLQKERDEDRFERMKVAAVFGGEVAETSEAPKEEKEEEEFRGSHHDHPGAETQRPAFAPPGTMEEEEIEEEETDISSYVEDLDEDAQFEELEEETTEAGGRRVPAEELAAAEEAGSESAVPAEAGEAESAEEEAEEETQESELEEAQEEAEALLDAEARGNGTVDARAEVRAPAGTAGYQQPAPRPAWDRRRGRRGGGGGRRFRSRRDFQTQHTPLVSDLLKEGQEILVQIAKEPIGKKGARITSHIALPGRFLVYMPTVNHTGVSRKIASEDERFRLKRIVMSERENGHGGFIVRTAAQGAAEDELRADIRFLKGLWNEIKSRAESGKAPALIYHDLNVVERVLRDQVTSDFTHIWVDTEQEYERILRFANRFQPALIKRVKLYTKETPLFEQFGLTDEINKALKSKVWLKSGGYIVINQTEALVAIDINTGKYVGKTSRLEDTIVKTNVDAIKEIVRQIRLRDLGGIIIIDFIDMDERRNRQKVMQALEEALRSDRAPSKVLQFNDFGLVAITRKRVKQSLERTIGTPCPYCTATGYVKSVNTVCNEIYVEMRKITKQLEHSDVLLRVNPEVAKALKANNGRWLTEMEELTGKTIIVKSDPAVHQEQFDIN